MSLSYSVGRTLYRALLSAASALDVQLSRCESKSLRDREIESLRTAISKNLPRELRGLLEIDPRPRIKPTSTSTNVRNTIHPYVRTCSRRIAEASTADELRELSLDGTSGFGAVRHLHERVEALRHMVYDKTSNAERFGIQVGVESEFQGADRNRYFFKYRVRIFNNSEDTVKLLSRAWTIRDLDGRVTSVEGPGVVGAFPTLAPNQTYEYSSAVPLQTPLGTQSGYYMFVTLIEEDNENGERQERVQEELELQKENENGSANAYASTKMLQVPIAPFSHITPSMDMGGSSSDSIAEAAAVPSTGGSVKSGRRKRRNKGANRASDKGKEGE